MKVTKPASASRADVTSVLLMFRGDLFDTNMRRLHDCRTEAERAAKSGVSRQTLHRLRRRPLTETPSCAHQLAAASGLTVDDLFPHAIPMQAAA